MDQPQTSNYIAVADIEVTAVTPDRSGFTLEGLGADRADYRIRLEMEVPVDNKTRSVLGEMLSQSKWRLSRRVVSNRQILAAAPKPRSKPTA